MLGIGYKVTDSRPLFPVLQGNGSDALIGLPGVLSWWDSAWGGSIDGSGRADWYDRKAGARATSSVAGTIPAYSATSFNGAPGWTFDGVDDRMVLGSTMPSWPSGAAESTIWAVVKQDVPGATASTQCIFSYGGSNGNNSRALSRTQVTATSRATARAGTGAGVTAATDGAVDFSSRHLVEAKFGATQVEVKIDGGTSTTAAAVPSTTLTTFRMGCLVGNSGFWAGVIRHVVITDGTLSAQNITDLRTFLLGQR